MADQHCDWVQVLGKFLRVSDTNQRVIHTQAKDLQLHKTHTYAHIHTQHVHRNMHNTGRQINIEINTGTHTHTHTHTRYALTSTPCVDVFSLLGAAYFLRLLSLCLSLFFSFFLPIKFYRSSSLSYTNTQTHTNPHHTT